MLPLFAFVLASGSGQRALSVCVGISGLAWLHPDFTGLYCPVPAGLEALPPVLPAPRLLCLSLLPCTACPSPPHSGAHAWSPQPPLVFPRVSGPGAAPRWKRGMENLPRLVQSFSLSVPLQMLSGIGLKKIRKSNFY